MPLAKADPRQIRSIIRALALLGWVWIITEAVTVVRMIVWWTFKLLNNVPVLQLITIHDAVRWVTLVSVAVAAALLGLTMHRAATAQRWWGNFVLLTAILLSLGAERVRDLVAGTSWERLLWGYTDTTLDDLAIYVALQACTLLLPVLLVIRLRRLALASRSISLSRSFAFALAVNLFFVILFWSPFEFFMHEDGITVGSLVYAARIPGSIGNTLSTLALGVLTILLARHTREVVLPRSNRLRHSGPAA